MKKSDLKAGYVIQYTDNTYAMVMYYFSDFNNESELRFIREGGTAWTSVNNYDENFKHLLSWSAEELSIKRIYGYPNDIRYAFTCSPEGRKLLWSRDETEMAVKMTVEEIENALGHKIEIVSNK